MHFLHIKDHKTYSKVEEHFKEYLEQLGKTINLKKVFSHQNVGKNVYLVQKVYEKKTVDGRLDESIFLKEHNPSNQPPRLTPFARKAPLAPKNNFNLSHKLLNFESMEEDQ